MTLYGALSGTIRCERNVNVMHILQCHWGMHHSPGSFHTHFFAYFFFFFPMHNETTILKSQKHSFTFGRQDIYNQDLLMSQTVHDAA